MDHEHARARRPPLLTDRPTTAQNKHRIGMTSGEGRPRRQSSMQLYFLAKKEKNKPNTQTEYLKVKNDNLL
jgi:hypothetical protein